MNDPLTQSDGSILNFVKIRRQIDATPQHVASYPKWKIFAKEETALLAGCAYQYSSMTLLLGVIARD